MIAEGIIDVLVRNAPSIRGALANTADDGAYCRLPAQGAV